MFLKIAVTQATLLGGQVTVNQRSVAEYIRRQGERYAEADRTEKTRILDEVVAVTGYHRKSVARRLSERRTTGPRGCGGAAGAKLGVGAAHHFGYAVGVVGGIGHSGFMRHARTQPGRNWCGAHRPRCVTAGRMR